MDIEPFLHWTNLVQCLRRHRTHLNICVGKYPNMFALNSPTILKQNRILYIAVYTVYNCIYMLIDLNKSCAVFSFS